MVLLNTITDIIKETLFELQSDTSVVVLPAEKINLTLFIIVRTIWENVWMMWTMTHINYLKIDPTNKIKAKALKDNKFINKLYYFVGSIFLSRITVKPSHSICYNQNARKSYPNTKFEHKETYTWTTATHKSLIVVLLNKHT